MVVENLFVPDWVERRPTYSFFLGIIFTLIGFGTSYLLFGHSSVRHFIGISTILFTITLALPGILKLFSIEEKIETGKKISFFKEHRGILDFYIYFFIGVFLVFFFIALISPKLVFSQEQLYNINVDESALPQKNLPAIFETNDTQEIFSIFKNNVYVMIVSFILSLFYGSGSLFLITLNASIFASALSRIVRLNIIGLGIFDAFTFGLCQLGIMFLHGIPELTSYFLAAIAGGVLSKAVTSEKFMSVNFKRVVDDALALMFIAFFIVAFAAIIEVIISKKLFFANVCSNNYWIYAIVAVKLAIIGFIVWLERKRLRI